MLTLLSQILGYQIVVYASNGAPGAEPLIVGATGLPVLYLYHTSYDGSAPGSPNHYNTLISSLPHEPMASTLMMLPFAPTSAGMLHNFLGSWI